MARGKYKRKRERRLQEETERIQKAAQACKLSQHMSKLVFDMGIKELCQKTDERTFSHKRNWAGCAQTDSNFCQYGNGTGDRCVLTINHKMQI